MTHNLIQLPVYFLYCYACIIKTYLLLFNISQLHKSNHYEIVIQSIINHKAGIFGR